MTIGSGAIAAISQRRWVHIVLVAFALLFAACLNDRGTPTDTEWRAYYTEACPIPQWQGDCHRMTAGEKSQIYDAIDE